MITKRNSAGHWIELSTNKYTKFSGSFVEQYEDWSVLGRYHRLYGPTVPCDMTWDVNNKCLNSFKSKK